MTNPKTRAEERYARAMAEAAAFRRRQAEGSAESVDRFLESRGEMRDVLEALLEDTVTIASLGGDPAGDWIEQPEQIGPYRILDTLGMGGMGVVYLAEQQEPVQRKVALKVIKLGMDTREVLARFEVERQALAVMNHPAIAKVFDAGLTEQGQPYFVMEYVEGIPLTGFCDLHRLSLRGRIHIFQQVCLGVQHAHQKGVLHRDLKPANILVCREGPQLVVKIIDFGLARATDQRLVEQTIYTEKGKIIGTPEYMSPEQARGRAEEIDHRTDIYSLGVILYQLLTGELPFESADLRRAGLLEVYRTILEQVPDKPSSRIAAIGDRASLRARDRKLSANSLRKRLRGELDWIAMKALAKEPAQRYASATALALDLRRYLQHEPVHAGPPSLGYRVNRLVRRHRTQLLAGLAVVAIAVASLFVVWSYALEIGRQSGVLQREQERAERSRRQAVAEAEVAGEQRQRADDQERRAEDLARKALEQERELAALREREHRDRGESGRAAELLQEAVAQAAAAEQAARAAADRETDLRARLAVVRDGYLQLGFRFRHLAVGAALRVLQREARSHLPASPQNREAIARFVAEADAAVAELPAVRMTLRQLEVDALLERHPQDAALLACRDALRVAMEAPGGEVLHRGAGTLPQVEPADGHAAAVEASAPRLAPEQIDDLCAAAFARFPTRFVRPQDRLLHETLLGVERDLLAFRAGLLVEMRRSSYFAERVAALTLAHPGARVTWDEARDAIRKADGITASRSYASQRIDLTPQWGLVPIGMNPKTLLWEFYDLRSAWDADDLGSLPIPVHQGERGEVQMAAGTGIVFVLLPGDTFYIGSQSSDAAGANYDPNRFPGEDRHRLRLSPFFLARHELTSGQWLRLAGGADPSQHAGDPVHPVERVSWSEASDLLDRFGLVLPTEAQWEYACRAGTITIWYPGDRPELLQGHANVLDLTGMRHRSDGVDAVPFHDLHAVHAPVGSFRANAFGMHDMHGNVEEWCQDRHGAYALPVEAGDGERRVPDGEPVRRVVRGGSFRTAARHARSACRSDELPHNRSDARGLRAARHLAR